MVVPQHWRIPVVGDRLFGQAEGRAEHEEAEADSRFLASRPVRRLVERL